MPVSSTLFIGHREVANVFQLLGDDEDSISLAIAWALTDVPSVLTRFVKRTTDYVGDEYDAQIRIHKHEKAGGITDIELTIPGRIHVICRGHGSLVSHRVGIS